MSAYHNCCGLELGLRRKQQAWMEYHRGWLAAFGGEDAYPREKAVQLGSDMIWDCPEETLESSLAPLKCDQTKILIKAILRQTLFYLGAPLMLEVGTRHPEIEWI